MFIQYTSMLLSLIWAINNFLPLATGMGVLVVEAFMYFSIL